MTTEQGQPLLQSLPADIRERIEALPVLELPGGTQVFDVHARCAGFPIIMSGTVRVFKQLANGRRIELYRVTPEEACILSLGCLLGGGNYPATGVTAGPACLRVMPPELFNACLAADDGFRKAVFRSLGDRLVHTMELVEEIATLRLDVRLAMALLAHGERAMADADGSRRITITHQELADELGTVREIVSRLLDDFESQGMVELGRGRVTLRDASRLRHLAEQR